MWKKPLFEVIIYILWVAVHGYGLRLILFNLVSITNSDAWVWTKTRIRSPWSRMSKMRVNYWNYIKYDFMYVTAIILYHPKKLWIFNNQVQRKKYIYLYVKNILQPCGISSFTLDGSTDDWLSRCPKMTIVKRYSYIIFRFV